MCHGNSSLKKKKDFAEGCGLMLWSMLLKKELKNLERLSCLCINHCSELWHVVKVSIIPVGSHYNSFLGMVLLCHNSWPKYGILLVKILRPHFIFHFAHCLSSRVFYDPVSQQTNNVRYCNISPYNRALESQRWF